MDSFWTIFVLMAIIVISDQIGGKKKRVPPRPLPKAGEKPGMPKMPMPWPDIKPPVPQEPQETEVYVEEEPQVPVLKQPMLRRAESVARSEQHMEGRPSMQEPRPSGMGLTPEQAMSALAWAEILGKPKAYQSGPFRK